MIVTNSLSGGGAERSMNLICNELTNRGWPIALVTLNAGHADHVMPICEVFPIERQWRSGALQTLSAIRKFKAVVDLWDPDFLVLNCDLPELFGAVTQGTQKVIVVEHTSRPWSQRRLLGLLTRSLLRFRKSIWVAVSADLTIWPFGFKASSVLVNPIVFGLMSKIDTHKIDILRLVFIGRLSPEKRPELALQIAQVTNLPLVVIGDGPLREDLAKIATLNSKGVEFLGRIENPWSEFRLGDLLLVTSEYEGDGLVVIEGLHGNVPMLLSDVPDFHRFEFPDRNYCKTVEEFVNKIDTFRGELNQLMIPPELSQKILEARSLVAIGNLWEDLLKSFSKTSD